MNTEEAKEILENVLDALVEVGNGISDEELHKQCSELFRFRDEWFNKSIQKEYSWIDVNTSLPETNSKDYFGTDCSDLVIIRYVGNGYRTACYYPYEDIWRVENDENGYEPLGVVTHWMNIPKTP